MLFDLEYQNAFVNFIQSGQSKDSAFALIETRWQCRADIYRKNFIARLVGILSDHHLDVPIRLFGRECIEQILLRYFAKYPPVSKDMVDSLANLYEFILNSSEDPLFSLLADLVKVSLDAWYLLIGENPSSDKKTSEKIDEIFPRFVRFVQPVSASNLFQAWVQAACETNFSPDDFLVQESAILLVKSSSLAINFIKVTPNLYPLVKCLANGAGLSSSILQLTDKELEKIKGDDLKNWLQYLLCNL